MSDRAAKQSDREKRVTPDDEAEGADSPPANGTPEGGESGPNPAAAPAKPAGPKTARFARRGIGASAAAKAEAAVGRGSSPEVSVPTKSGKGKGAKKKAKEEEKTLELEPISPFERGISIGIKFAALTAAVVALSMILLGYLTYSITSQEVNDQINEGGVIAVSALEKGTTRVFWLRPDEFLKDVISELDPPPDKPAENAPPEVKGHYERDLANWQKKPTFLYEKLKQNSQNELNARLKSLVDQSSNQILSVAIVERAGSSESALAIYPTSLSVAVSRLTTIGNVDVSEGTLDVEGKKTRVRRFDKPIVDVDGKQLTPQTPGATPYAAVFVNAAKIDDVKGRVAERIMLVTALGALAGVILTAVIAAVLSRPIRALESDIAAVAEGNLDHETVVRSKDEIGALAHTFNIMTRNLKSAQQHAADRKAIERELAIATEIQTKLLPERIPQIPGLDIHSFYLSAKEVGGDYYDFIVIDQTHLGIIVADVSGKGIPGSMVMTMARSLVRLASVRNVSPGDTFKKVNRILAKDIRRGMFVTSIYMVLNVKTHELKVASAGHNPLVVFRAESGEIELVKPQGIALGFDKGTIFDNHIKEVELQLKPGDRICAFTDGVNEAMNAESEEFGDDRFYNLVKQHARLSSKDFVNAIVTELEAHRGSAEQSDDITITTLAVLK